MKKVLLLVLVAGILMLGISSAAAEVSGNSFKEIVDFSDSNFGDGIGDPAPNGEGPGGGGGGFPG